MKRAPERGAAGEDVPSAEVLLNRLDALEREARLLAREILALYDQLDGDRPARPSGRNGAQARAAGERLEHVIGVYEAGTQLVDALQTLESAAHEKRPTGMTRRGAR